MVKLIPKSAEGTVANFEAIKEIRAENVEKSRYELDQWGEPVLDDDTGLPTLRPVAIEELE